MAAAKAASTSAASLADNKSLPLRLGAALLVSFPTHNKACKRKSFDLRMQRSLGTMVKCHPTGSRSCRMRMMFLIRFLGSIRQT